MAGAKENTSDHLLEIWAYEARRLFRDRLVGQDGTNKFDNILMNVVRGDWSANIFDELDSKIFEPRCEKTGLRGFRPGPT